MEYPGSHSTSSPLLPTNSSAPKRKATITKKLMVFSIFLTACVAFSLGVLYSSYVPPNVHAYLHVQSNHDLHSNESSVGREHAPRLNKLTHPVVILISTDGFRFGYQYKTETPNIARLIREGTEAERGLIPVFPSETFPNHYSIATGLYPPYHGIIYNNFYDPVTKKTFRRGNNDPDFWLGEPLWATVAKLGHNAASYFWPGSEVEKTKWHWTCPSDFCPKYDMSVEFEKRVDHVLGYFGNNNDAIPWFIDLYFDAPDTQGHIVGPDDPLITAAVTRIDSMIGRLIKGLEDKGILDEVHIILLGDHGMVANCELKDIFLNLLPNEYKIEKSWVEIYGPVLGIRPPEGTDLTDVARKMNKGLEHVYAGKNLTVYLRENIPSRFHYKHSVRIPPIFGVVEEGYRVFYDEEQRHNHPCGGSHGYDNALFSMRSIFIGRGPRFQKAHKVESFKNIEIYNVVTNILGIKGAPNNGTKGFPEKILLPIPNPWPKE